MTRFLLVLSAAALSVSPAAAAERRYAVADFDRVVVEGPYVVSLVTGRATTAAADGSVAALDRLLIDVSGRTLRIRRDRHYWGGNPGAQEGPVEIVLTTRTLRSARIVGPGRLDIERVQGLRVDLVVEGSGELRAGRVEADNLSLGLAGGGRIELSGTARALTADVQGTGDIAGAGLIADSARITTTTTGRIELGVRRAADVNALGLGIVDIVGTPACTVRGANAALVRCGDGRLSPRP